MARASHTLLVIACSFKERVEEIAFNKDSLTVSQDFQSFCKIFWCYFFFKEEIKKKRFKKKQNSIRLHSYLKVR